MAVSKNVSGESMAEAYRHGVRLFGENRVQEAEAKRDGFRRDCPEAAWHLIGHLQTNKARKAVELFDAVQSLDSLRLASSLDRTSAETGRSPLGCLVEVKVSDEPAKHGLPPGELERFLDDVAGLSNLRVEGLMTVAPYFDDAETARPYFRRARELFERHSGRFGPKPVLSMGMTHDFEVAVEEGANLVRLGTAVFGDRPPAGASA
jgi:pyridoxal phosphate enzyme (YggS family)